MTGKARRSKTLTVRWSTDAVAVAEERVSTWWRQYAGVDGAGEVVHVADKRPLLLMDVAALVDATRAVLGHDCDADRFRAERDALSLMLREAARKVVEERLVARLANERALEWRSTVDELLAELRALKSSVAALAADFRQRSDHTLVKAAELQSVEDECDSPAECHASTELYTWLLAAREVEKVLGIVPATEPKQAADMSGEVDTEARREPHEVVIREDTDSVRSPGWYKADCMDCDWYTTGSEPNCEEAAQEHEIASVNGPACAEPEEG